MVDKIAPQLRSKIMQSIRGKDTRPELAIRKMLHRLGYRFRIHKKGLPGTPDIYLAKHRTAVFVHGCFWHGHQGCRRAQMPTTNQEFWASKIERTIQRDADAVDSLESQGIRVLTIWQCELREPIAIERRIAAHFEAS